MTILNLSNSTCDNADMVFIVADSKPHGPFCHHENSGVDSKSRRRRSWQYNFYTEKDEELKGSRPGKGNKNNAVSADLVNDGERDFHEGLGPSAFTTRAPTTTR